MTRLLMAATGP